MSKAPTPFEFWLAALPAVATPWLVALSFRWSFLDGSSQFAEPFDVFLTPQADSSTADDLQRRRRDPAALDPVLNGRARDFRDLGSLICGRELFQYLSFPGSWAL